MCLLIDELSKLKKSSMESVDSSESYSAFQKYMHVSRFVEEELECILKEQADHDKTLVLLCGSVGDGKSHMLAYFKNETVLLDDYQIINDATESQFPTKTSKECLAKSLEEFSDAMLYDGKQCKVIVAINLGTLSNFLESEEGSNYNYLRDYVNEVGLISSTIDSVVNNKFFSNINFANYQIYELTSDGIKSSFLSSLFGKVFGKNIENPFYAAFKNCDSLCSKKCPVYANFKLLMNEKYRESIIGLLEKAIVCEKLLLSARSILNLIYDIVVAPELENENNAQQSVGKISQLLPYLYASTPFLLFEKKERSTLLESISKFDPMFERKLSNDELSITFNYSDNLVSLSNQGLTDNVYFPFIKLFEKNGSLKFEKNKFALNKLNIRMKSLEHGFIKSDKEFSDYISSLYSFNVGKKQGIKDVYGKFRKAIFKWNGLVKNEHMIIPMGETKYTISQEIKISNDLSKLIYMSDSELKKFKKDISLSFASENGGTPLTVDVDYKLYSLINSISEGYRPNINDKNVYVNFNEIVNRLIKEGDYSNRILITENSPHGKTFIVEKNDFEGYNFVEVVDVRF